MGNSDEKILSLLKESGDGFLSGAELGATLGLSRTAVWKHIQGLRQEGYSIEGIPSHGYRLKPSETIFNEFELTSVLDTSLLGRPLIFHQNTDSTNKVACAMAEEDAPEGTAVIADCQGHGKGRMGREWVSPPGVNLYLSIVLRPTIDPARAPQLTFLAAVATIECIRKTLSDLNPVIKWPNDILINSKKVCGILTEMNSELDRVHFVILGLGVNINMVRHMFPEVLRSKATSLKIESGGGVDRVRFAGALLYEIERNYMVFRNEGFAPILEKWRAYALPDGKKATVKQFDEEIVGAIAGVDDSGALLLRRDVDDKVVRVLTGDLVLS